MGSVVILVYNNRFSKLNRLKTQDYESKIWEFVGSKISYSALWRKVGGHKQTCFDVIHDMVQKSELKETTKGNKKFVVRLDTIKDKEFEFGLTFQQNMLKTFRDELKKERKPLFKSREKATPRTKSIKRTLEILNMYLNAIQLFKARTYLQYDLHKDKAVGNPMSKAKRNRRIIWIESIYSEHWNEIGNIFPKDHSAIFKFWVQNFEIERFKVS